MKIKLTRTTRGNPGESMNHVPQEVFAELTMDPEHVVKLMGFQPNQMLPGHSHESDDRRWAIKDPLMFHTLVTSIAHRRSYSERVPQLVTILDLMGSHLTDDWELSWDTMTDMELEIHTDHQEIDFGRA